MGSRAPLQICFKFDKTGFDLHRSYVFICVMRGDEQKHFYLDHTPFSSRGGAKLCAFPCYCLAENMQLCSLCLENVVNLTTCELMVTAKCRVARLAWSHNARNAALSGNGVAMSDTANVRSIIILSVIGAVSTTEGTLPVRPFVSMRWAQF